MSGRYSIGLMDEHGREIKIMNEQLTMLRRSSRRHKINRFGNHSDDAGSTEPFLSVSFWESNAG
jgi:hypothetical protein